MLIRMGKLNDFTKGIDIIRDREIIDLTKNPHGTVCIEFLNDAKMCMLNGRFGEKSNNFTCIKTGKSVVD